MLSVIMVLKIKIKIKTQRNKNHKKNNLHFFAKLFINIQFIYHQMVRDEINCSTCNIQRPWWMKWKCRRYREIMFFASIQYKNRKTNYICCSNKSIYTRSAISLKTIQALSFLKLCSNGTSWSFNRACLLYTTT